MPKLSFIVTSYNYAQYIEECIESILAQTYQNIEIIVVDDHSRDNSVEVVNSIIRNHKSEINIKLIPHKSTKGQLASIFDGILAASGDFIACIASDDRLSKDFALTHMAIHLFQNTALSVCELYEIDEKSTLTTLNSNIIPKTNNGTLINEIKVKINDLNVKSIVKILDKKANHFGGWWWAPLSCAVFRKSTILPFLTFDKLNNWRYNPEKILFNFLHLIGGSIKIYEPLVGYRSFGHNAGGATPILGNINYNIDEVKKNYLKTQFNLFNDTIYFFQKEKNNLINLYSKNKYSKLLKEIYFAIPKLLKQKFSL